MTEMMSEGQGFELPTTLVEQIDEEPQHNLELAAARSEIRVVHLLQRAFEGSELSQKDLAQRIGVTEGRVSQVLNSEGNLRVTTIARYLRALGYRFEMNAEPQEPGTNPLRQRVPRRRKRASQQVSVYALHSRSGMQKVLLSTHRDDSNPGAGSFEYVGGASMESAQRAVQQIAFTRGWGEIQAARPVVEGKR